MIIASLWLAFLIATLIQFIYWILIYGRLSFFYKQNTTVSSDDKKEGVSIIIPARNEKKNLEKLIPLLFQQDYPNFEIIVVNDQSHDGTRFLLERLMTQFPKLRTVTIDYTPKHVTPKKYALTLGIKVAKNDVILLTDADCVPVSPNWIKSMSYPIRNQGKTFALGYGGYEIQKGFLNTLIQFETWLTALQYFSFALWKSPYMGVGRNLAYRRSFFMEKKAFNGLWQIMGGDDDLFINRYAHKKNTAVVIHPESITKSIPKTTIKEYYIQKKRHFQAGKHYRFADKLKIGIYAMSHLVFWASGLILLGIHREWEPISLLVGIIITRAFLQFSGLNGARMKLEGQGKVFWTMFFDLMYLSYFWIIGTKGYLSKTVRWK
ncbi:glycosyltransferase [Echinicola jeungdonensis]|uniref:Glycosyltransferase n=1 Tax=Echinicola jeungdonensis TaxID=709343 RepID=A0ABV5JA84_9BACT|nr:glycosyltransferase [Echinicola jeungdonensis]MDN3669704.1 glycosyltransferase [Echinicola jeungdonensis]